MKRIIDGTEYTINPIPPYLTPSMMLYSRLAKKEAQTVEEAEKTEAEMKAIVDKVLNASVWPAPAKGHASELFKAVNNLTAKVMNNLDMEFFPEEQKVQGSQKRSDVDGPNATPTTDNTSRNGRKSK